MLSGTRLCPNCALYTAADSVKSCHRMSLRGHRVRTMRTQRPDGALAGRRTWFYTLTRFLPRGVRAPSSSRPTTRTTTPRSRRRRRTSSSCRSATRASGRSSGTTARASTASASRDRADERRSAPPDRFHAISPRHVAPTCWRHLPGDECCYTLPAWTASRAEAARLLVRTRSRSRGCTRVIDQNRGRGRS